MTIPLQLARASEPPRAEGNEERPREGCSAFRVYTFIHDTTARGPQNVQSSEFGIALQAAPREAGHTHRTCRTVERVGRDIDKPDTL